MWWRSVGDGALTGGLSYEALANIGAHGVRAIIVLNDNGGSYAPTVSRLSTAGRDVEGAAAGAPAAFFASLGIAYEGPVVRARPGRLEGRLAGGAGRRSCRPPRAHREGPRLRKPPRTTTRSGSMTSGPWTGQREGRTERVAPGDSYTEAFGASLLREAEAPP